MFASSQHEVRSRIEVLSALLDELVMSEVEFVVLGPEEQSSVMARYEAVTQSALQQMSMDFEGAAAMGLSVYDVEAEWETFIRRIRQGPLTR
jgi:hypothetical protein